MEPSVRSAAAWTGRPSGFALLLGCALGFGVAATAWGQDDEPEHPDLKCLNCHGQEQIATFGPRKRLAMVGAWAESDAEAGAEAEAMLADAPEIRPALFVLHEDLASSPHATLLCVDCHDDAGELPHPPKLNRATCANQCHTDQWTRYTESSHGAGLENEDEGAPTCTSCHGGHDVLLISDRAAPQHRLNSLFLCQDCHAEHGESRSGVNGDELMRAYLDSAHAKAVQGAGLLWAATCVDCHDAHRVLGADDPRSSVSRERILDTCASCHLGVAEKFVESVHGTPQQSGDDAALVCIDCHTGHSITRASSPEFMRDIVAECGGCHDNRDNGSTRRSTSYATYAKSYHGQVSELGSLRAARCSDCHGSHEIVPLDDPESIVGPAHLVETCAQEGCHAGANKSFVSFDPHADYRDRANYPVLYAVWWYFLIMMTSVFTLFGVHTLLWFARSLAHRVRHGPAPRHGRPKTAIRRFSMLNRVNHALVVLTFFGLTATGIPLVFADHRWAAVLAGLFGGIEAAGIWHRVFAVMLIINFALHFLGLGRAFLRRRCGWREWLFGPGSLVPRWKDVRDCFGMIRWFFGRGRMPRFDRWTYWEKFDYWAEVFGSMIIGGTGLLLWFPELASRVLPGWSFNVAMIVHGYEALLAIGFIFTIHFFNAHVRPGKFPVDDVIFTGSVSEEEFEHERPEEYRRLVESGGLEALRVPAPSPGRRWLWVLFAIVAVGIGLTLLTLIVLGGVGVL